LNHFIFGDSISVDPSVMGSRGRIMPGKISRRSLILGGTSLIASSVLSGCDDELENISTNHKLSYLKTDLGLLNTGLKEVGELYLVDIERKNISFLDRLDGFQLSESHWRVGNFTSNTEDLSNSNAKGGVVARGKSNVKMGSGVSLKLTFSDAKEVSFNGVISKISSHMRKHSESSKEWDYKSSAGRSGQYYAVCTRALIGGKIEASAVIKDDLSADVAAKIADASVKHFSQQADLIAMNGKDIPMLIGFDFYWPLLVEKKDGWYADFRPNREVDQDVFLEILRSS
jgi:hypothetical protein